MAIQLIYDLDKLASECLKLQPAKKINYITCGIYGQFFVVRDRLWTTACPQPIIAYPKICR